MPQFELPFLSTRLFSVLVTCLLSSLILWRFVHSLYPTLLYPLYISNVPFSDSSYPSNFTTDASLSQEERKRENSDNSYKSYKSGNSDNRDKSDIWVTENRTLSVETVSAVDHGFGEKTTENVVLNCGKEVEKLERLLLDLEDIFGYDPLRRSIKSGGKVDRTSSLLQKILVGKQLTITMVGGSVSAGAKLKSDQDSYGGHFINILTSIFPSLDKKLEHDLIPIVLPLSGSSVLHYCMEEIVKENCVPFGVHNDTGDLLTVIPQCHDGSNSDPDVFNKIQKSDLVLLDLAAGDYFALQPTASQLSETEMLRDAEFVLRKFLMLPEMPFVMFVHFAHFFRNTPLNPQLFATAEQSLAKLSSYYDVPSVSITTAMGPLLSEVVVRRCKSCPNNQFMWDSLHPTNEGHLVMANAVFYLLLTEFVSVLKHGEMLEKKKRLNLTSLLAPSALQSLLPASSQRNVLSQLSKFYCSENNKNAPLDIADCEKNDTSCTNSVGWPIVSKLPSRLFFNSSSEKLYCKFAHSWEVQTGYNNSVWILKDTANFDYRYFGKTIKHWTASERSNMFNIVVDFGESKWFGVIFKKGYSRRYKDAGAEVYLDGELVTSVSGFLYGSQFTAWYLHRRVGKISSPGEHVLSFRPLSQGFEVLALIAE